MSNTSFASAINDALKTAMAIDPKVICYGLGVDDPKHVFGTTAQLQELYGPDRVFDMPIAENGMTGIGIGAALYGLRPVMTHQRLDFALLSLDQIVNNAAKWFYMFGGQRPVPLTVRMILGRGWGQGPTHSQSLHSWFAHIPGLKVVMPATAEDAKGLLLSSIFDDNPVIFLEHRWLHNVQGHVPAGDVRVPLGKANRLRQGTDVTIVAMSYMTLEAVHAVEYLAQHGITADLIDLRTVSPLDWDTIEESVKLTGRLLALDVSFMTGSVAGEIVAHAAEHWWDVLTVPPRRLALPDVPEPTSPALTEGYHVRAENIVEMVADMLGRTIDTAPLVAQRTFPHDVPGNWFSGPF